MDDLGIPSRVIVDHEKMYDFLFDFIFVIFLPFVLFIRVTELVFQFAEWLELHLINIRYAIVGFIFKHLYKNEIEEAIKRKEDVYKVK